MANVKMGPDIACKATIAEDVNGGFIKRRAIAQSATRGRKDRSFMKATCASGDLGSGKIALCIFNKADAALEKTDYRLVVELMGLDAGDQRCGVDIVAVLDVSGSMDGNNLEKLKTSMKFLVKKLSPTDRLSIVTFLSTAVRLCPLTGMNKNGQAKIEMLINKLEANGCTNITRGLTEALNVLAQRIQQDGRTSAIMLMADGELTNGFDHPSTVDVSGVPVYTFGLGRDHGSQEVRVGSYNQARVNDSVTISFGNLYNCEKRSTTVFLSLPAVEERMAMDILKLAFSYRIQLKICRGTNYIRFMLVSDVYE
ncbi:uncharacterized protein LOC141588613 [Silene latifolia]|uniref:uncharacterized protein LOC141588613 n=1 Tax=Silene latifolia TaxID=37657 RepID=UPI003D788DEC